MLYIGWEQIVQRSTSVEQNHDVRVEAILVKDSQQALEQAGLSHTNHNFENRASSPDDFVYKNRKWGGDCPNIEYLINVNTDQVDNGDGTEEDFRQAIINAARTWNAVDGADFVLSYGGETDAEKTSYNGSNEIIFAHKGTTEPSGLARIWYTLDYVIVEADIWINADYQWDTTGAPSADELDLQSVAVHEFGHWLALGHDDSGDAIMFSTVTMGTVKRDLHQNDIDGINFVYPRRADSPCATGEVPSKTATPMPTPTPSETATPSSTATATSTPTPSATSTPPDSIIPTFTPTINVTIPVLATETPVATATATVPPQPEEAGELQSNYASGAPGSFFTIIGERYEQNQALLVNFVNSSGLIIQEQNVQAGTNGEFSIIIGTAGAPAGRYTVEISQQDAERVYQSAMAAGANITNLSLLLDPSESLREQEPINRSTEIPTFEFPLINTSRLLYLPFIY